MTLWLLLLAKEKSPKIIPPYYIYYMKRLFTFIGTALACTSLSAQSMEQAQENPDLFRAVRDLSRKEIILPDVDGYKAFKTDLHIHTIFSDGRCTPEFRAEEAWRDGLDAIAITDHIEIILMEAQMKDFLHIKERGEVNLNFPVYRAQSEAERYGLLVIPGTEISRSPEDVGHFNALFTTDNNRIPDDDPLVAIRNAKAQDAIVQFNHPGWARHDANLTEVAKKAMEEGLIDGIEAFNGEEFYPRSIEDATNNNCYVAGNSDIHPTTHDFYLRSGYYRNMTIVFAKECTLPAIKEALLAKRTVAYGCGNIAGSQEMLEKFFFASIDIRKTHVNDDGSGHILITNKTSFPYLLKGTKDSVNVLLPPLSSILVRFEKDEMKKFTVSNMYYGVNKNLEVSVQL